MSLALHQAAEACFFDMCHTYGSGILCAMYFERDLLEWLRHGLNAVHNYRKVKREHAAFINRCRVMFNGTTSAEIAGYIDPPRKKRTRQHSAAQTGPPQASVEL